MSITNEDIPFEIEVRVAGDDTGDYIIIDGFPNPESALAFSEWIRTKLGEEPPPSEFRH